MPDFNIKLAKKRKPKQLPRYKLLGANDWISFTFRGDYSIRAKFYNVLVDLSLPTGTHNPGTHEHSYVMTTQAIKN